MTDAALVSHGTCRNASFTELVRRTGVSSPYISPVTAGFARRDSKDARVGRPVVEDTREAQAARDAAIRAKLARKLTQAALTSERRSQAASGQRFKGNRIHSERNAAILRLWDQDMSALQIAEALGCGKGAVIGVLKRCHEADPDITRRGWGK